MWTKVDGDGTKNKGRLQGFLGFDRIWSWCYSAVNTHFSSRSREMTLKEIQRLSEPPPWFQDARWSLPKALGGGATPWSHRGGATWNPGGRNRPSRGQDPLLELQGWSYVPVALEGRVRTKQNYSQVLWSHGICLARFWPCLELITSFLSSDFSLLELECWCHASPTMVIFKAHGLCVTGSQLERNSASRWIVPRVSFTPDLDIYMSLWILHYRVDAGIS